MLKGLLNTGDADALAAALAERRFLAEVEHPDIVKIFDFVEHGSDGYIVMEYVGGKSLRGLLEDHRAANDGEPLPAAHAIAYIHEILPALGYLHRRGLLFCDFKPDNVMQTGTSLKLIDLGGVYRMDDATSPIYGTTGYQAPEIADDRSRPFPSDLFTVGRTLAVLCTNFRGFQSTYEFTLPPQSEVPLYATYDSLYRFLQRATALNPDDRFQTADEMADQLFGVLREVVASRDRSARARGQHDVHQRIAAATTTVPTGARCRRCSCRPTTRRPASSRRSRTTADDADALVDGARAVARSDGRSRTASRTRTRSRPAASTRRRRCSTRSRPRTTGSGGSAWYRGLMWLSTNEPEAALEEFEAVYRDASG